MTCSHLAPDMVLADLWLWQSHSRIITWAFACLDFYYSYTGIRCVIVYCRPCLAARHLCSFGACVHLVRAHRKSTALVRTAIHVYMYVCTCKWLNLGSGRRKDTLLPVGANWCPIAVADVCATCRSNYIAAFITGPNLAHFEATHEKQHWASDLWRHVIDCTLCPVTMDLWCSSQFQYQILYQSAPFRHYIKCPFPTLTSQAVLHVLSFWPPIFRPFSLRMIVTYRQALCFTNHHSFRVYYGTAGSVLNYILRQLLLWWEGGGGGLLKSSSGSFMQLTVNKAL